MENHFSRKDEIEKWIKIKGFKPGDFIIIDDDKSLNRLEEKFKKRLVLTDSYLGLQSSAGILEIINQNGG